MDFSISLPKTNYNLSEPIILESIIKNHNDFYVNIGDIGLRYGTLNLYITSPVNLTYSYFGPIIACYPNSIKLQPGSYFMKEIMINNNSYSFFNQMFDHFRFEFNLTGNYTIEATYSSRIIGYENDWRGQVNSNKIKFRIV